MNKRFGVLMLLASLAGCQCTCPPQAPTGEHGTACGPCGANGTPCGPDSLGTWKDCQCIYWCEAPNGDCLWFGAGETCRNPCEGATCTPPAP